MRLDILTSFGLLALISFCPDCQGEQNKQVECLRSIPLSMLSEMVESIQSIHQSLPRDVKRHRRLLPNFCGKKLDIAVVNKILDIYNDQVFAKLWRDGSERPRKFTDNFLRLQMSVAHCMERSQTTLSVGARKKIKLMEQTFIKLQPEDRSKAVGEFATVLRWISFYMDKKKSLKKCH